MPSKPVNTAKRGRRPKTRKFWKMGPNFRTGGAPPYQFENQQKLAMGQLVIGPPPGRQGFPDFPEAPLILVNKKSHRSLRDLENCGFYWLISERAKQVLEQVDPDAFAFVKCEVRFATGELGPDYWLCDVVRVLDAVDEAASRFDVFSFSSSLVFREDAVGSARIFRMSQRKTDVICDQSVKDACKAAGLKGFWFRDAAELHWLSGAEMAKRRLNRFT